MQLLERREFEVLGEEPGGEQTGPCQGTVNTPAIQADIALVLHLTYQELITERKS